MTPQLSHMFTSKKTIYEQSRAIIDLGNIEIRQQVFKKIFHQNCLLNAENYSRHEKLAKIMYLIGLYPQLTWLPTWLQL